MEAKRKRLTLDLDPPVQRRLKTIAAIKGISMRQYCLTAITRELSKDEAQGIIDLPFGHEALDRLDTLRREIFGDKVLRRVVRGELTVEDAVRLLEYLLASGIELRDEPSLHARALQISSRLRQGAVYDAHYLALADILGCEYWTADESFYRAVAFSAQSVHWIGEFPAPK